MASWSFRHDLSKNLGSVSTRCRKGSILGPRFFWPFIILLLSPAAAAAACSAPGFRRGGAGAGGEEEARVSPAALAWRRREGGRKEETEKRCSRCDFNRLVWFAPHPFKLSRVWASTVILIYFWCLALVSFLCPTGCHGLNDIRLT